MPITQEQYQQMLAAQEGQYIDGDYGQEIMQDHDPNYM